MTVRRIDPDTGDIVTAGDMFISGREEVAQTIRTRLRLFVGEYFRDITEGTPWYQTILGKGATLSERDAAIKRRILRTDGVVQVVQFSTDYDVTTRVFTVQADVVTQYGTIGINIDRTL